ncbi:hypothetical protein DH2020_023231 [Rehmannia glutinosa]|uniref:Uncharacterized protein n=1 Tax=Rehmannia glutinosa TaxID=99300 RepID=A0ABR0W4A9_REHGL
MGGKGRRRREKNYEAAHGQGHTRLPPPPDPTSADALPSKLRKIMTVARAVKQPFNRAKNNTGNGVEKGINSGEGTDSMTAGMKRKRNDQSLIAQHTEHRGEVPQISMNEKKKKKKKNAKKADDLRFEAVGEPAAAGSHRKERKKQLLEARKKKHKRPRSDDEMDFPGREEIKFGEVVQAPPKLTVPKAFKTTQDASQERLRLQAVDAYRKRKGWASRPGVKLPPPVTTSPF